MEKREHIGRIVDPKKLQPSDEVEMAHTKKEMLKYIAVKDRENVRHREYLIKKAVKKYGIDVVKSKLRGFTME